MAHFKVDQAGNERLLLKRLTPARELLMAWWNSSKLNLAFPLSKRALTSYLERINFHYGALGLRHDFSSHSTRLPE